VVIITYTNFASYKKSETDRESSGEAEGGIPKTIPKNLIDVEEH
jgi:hypothetical protein